MRLNNSQDKKELALLALFCSLYLIFTTFKISLPGVHFDEVSGAIGAVDILKKADSSFFLSARLFNRLFPLMVQPYDGSLGSYILIPFFQVFGINTFSLRIAPILFGLFTLLYTYFFTKELFNQKAAIISILLLSINPNYILGSKIGNPSSYAVFFLMAALFYLLKWHKTKRVFYFIIAVFLLGLGTSTISWFLWVVVAFLISGIIFHKDIGIKIREDKPNSFFSYCLWGITFFCLGNFLLLWGNLSKNFLTLRYVCQHFCNTKHGINNLNFISNFIARMDTFIYFLNGRTIADEIFYKRPGNIIFPYLFIFIFSWLIFSLFFSKNMYFKKKRVAFVLVFFVSILIQSCFTLSGFRHCHLFVLITFIQVIIAIGFVEITANLRKNILQKFFSCFLFILFSLSVLFNLKILKNNYDDLIKTGGRGMWSDAIYQLAAWVRESKFKNFVAMDFGFSRNLYFLTRGEVDINDCQMSEETIYHDYLERLSELLQDENNMYIFHAQEFTLHKKGQTVFREIVERQGKQLIEEKMFYQKDGSLIYIVYSAR